MSTKILVIAIILTIGALFVGLSYYFDERGRQDLLGQIPCAGLHPTVFEFQGDTVAVDSALTCRVMSVASALQPAVVPVGDNDDDPWHYFGRLRILAPNEAWFLIFVARQSSGFQPQFSLRRRKGAGWTLLGVYDAVPVLQSLGVYDRLDTAFLRSNESLKVIDQSGR